MAKKRPLAPPASPTDEWGIYDPSKAGMEALYSRLGRPILRAATDSDRRRRRRGGLRAERPADGVGMAIQEARRRASQMAEAQTALPEPEASSVTAAAAVAPPQAPAPAVVPAETAAAPAKKGRTKAAKSARRKLGAALDAAGARADDDAARATSAAAPVEALPKRAARAARGRAIAKDVSASPAVVAAPAVPPPSPRRPRGPVPLAAWAHAVSDTPRAEPKRAEAKGLWRGIFRIPSDVALVEYGRGCRIHRLVIEGGPDQPADPF